MPTISQTLGVAYAVCRSCYGQLAAVAAVCFGIAGLVAVALVLADLTGFSNVPGLIAGPLASVACYRIVDATRDGGHLSWRDGLAFSAGRLGTSLVIFVLTFVAVLVGMLMLILPGVWIAVVLSMSLPALVVEGRGALDSLQRSWEVVRGRWFYTFGCLIVGALIVAVIVLPIAVIVAVAVGLDRTDSDQPAALVMTEAVTVIASIVFVPFVSSLQMVLFHHLRERGPAVTTRAPRAGGDGPGWSAPASTPAPMPSSSSTPPPSASRPVPPRERPSAAPPSPPRADGRDDERDAFGNPISPPRADSDWEPPQPDARA